MGTTMMSESNGEEKQPILGPYCQKRRKVTLAVIVLSNACAWSCLSLIAPFFPIVAAEKGASETVIGIILGSSELVMFLLSPIIGKLLSVCNPKVFYNGGLIGLAFCNFIYGFLDQVPPGALFIVLCFVVRFVAAVAAAAMMTASFTMAGNNFPDRIGTVYGILETAVGGGFMAGPAIGGGLYQLGGFGLPFWVLGGVAIVCGITSIVVMPTQITVKKEAGPSSSALFRSAKIWIGIWCMVAVLMAITVSGPVFALYLQQMCLGFCIVLKLSLFLKQGASGIAVASSYTYALIPDFKYSVFQLNQSTVGLIFVTPPLAYSLTTPLWGLLLDKKIPSTSLMMIGLFCAAIALLFYGPAPFFTCLTPMLWLSIVTFALIGFSSAPVVISSMRCFVEGAREVGFKNDSSTFGLVAGLIQSSNCLGTFAGPLVGGALTDRFGFRWAMTAVSILLILTVICLTPYLIIKERRNRGKSVEHADRSHIVMKEQEKPTDNRDGCYHQ